MRINHTLHAAEKGKHTTSPSSDNSIIRKIALSTAPHAGLTVPTAPKIPSKRGLEKLVADSLARDWRRADGALMRIEKLLVDSGYLPGVVEAVKHKAGETHGLGRSGLKSHVSLQMLSQLS